MNGDGGPAGGMGVIILGLVVFGLVWGGMQIVELFDDEPVTETETKVAKADPTKAEKPLKATEKPVSAEADASAKAPVDKRRAFPRPAKALSAKARAERLAAILAKLSPPAEGGAEEGAESSSDSDAASQDTSGVKGGLSKAVIKDAVREIVPLVQECYELALAEDAGVAGRLQVKFEIVGDEEYGGLVASSEIVTPEGGRVPSALLAECVKESMYALDLPVPEGGGKVIVNYPFVFKTAPALGEEQP